MDQYILMFISLVYIVMMFTTKKFLLQDISLHINSKEEKITANICIILWPLFWLGCFIYGFTRLFKWDN